MRLFLEKAQERHNSLLMSAAAPRRREPASEEGVCEPVAHHDTDARGPLERGRVQRLRPERAEVLQRAVQLGVAGDPVVGDVLQEHGPVQERVAGELRDAGNDLRLRRWSRRSGRRG